jgi:DNA-binding transcriptional LysR family regulator
MYRLRFDLNGPQAMVAVVKHGGCSAAARNISQLALSRRIG